MIRARNARFASLDCLLAATVIQPVQAIGDRIFVAIPLEHS
jgi:hypothetical protein